MDFCVYLIEFWLSVLAGPTTQKKQRPTLRFYLSGKKKIMIKENSNLLQVQNLGSTPQLYVDWLFKSYISFPFGCIYTRC